MAKAILVLLVAVVSMMRDALALSSASSSFSVRTGAQTARTGEDKSPDIAFGTLTCMRWTGGTCYGALAGCDAGRGQTTCEDSLCMCARGHCATPYGTCEPRKGRLVGEHAIKFSVPYQENRSYIGFNASFTHPQHLFGGEDDCDASHVLKATPETQAIWNIALAGDGTHVHIELKAKPGQLMSIWKSRRRRTVPPVLSEQSSEVLQLDSELVAESANRSSSHERGTARPTWRSRLLPLESDGNLTSAMEGAAATDNNRIDHHEDFWPVLRPLDKVHPIEVTWRIRRLGSATDAPLELWHPQTGVALASLFSTELLKSNVVNEGGIGECTPLIPANTESTVKWLVEQFPGAKVRDLRSKKDIGCRKRNHVVVEPPLPPSMQLNLPEHRLVDFKPGVTYAAMLAILFCYVLGMGAVGGGAYYYYRLYYVDLSRLDSPEEQGPRT